MLNHLRWPNTVLAVCEYMSFAKTRQLKGCSSQAETWQVKNILMKEFDWQVKCDVFVVFMATWTIEYNLWLARHQVQYSPQIDTKEKWCSFVLARLDLSQSAKNWYDFTTQYYRYLSLSAFWFCLCFPITCFCTNWSDRRGGEISLECRGWMKKAPTASLHVITLVTADWYGSDSSWLISQIKIIETMKLFSVKLLGPN